MSSPALSGAADPLGATVRALFADLRHGGTPPEVPGALGGGGPAPGLPTGSVQRLLVGEAGRRHEGTEVRFRLRVSDGCIREARYQAYGCPYTLATCEWLARRLPQLPPLLEPSQAGAAPESAWAALEAVLGGALSWAEQLEIPPDRLERLLIIEDALRRAIGPL